MKHIKRYNDLNEASIGDSIEGIQEFDSLVGYIEDFDRSVFPQFLRELDNIVGEIQDQMEKETGIKPEEFEKMERYMLDFRNELDNIWDRFEDVCQHYSKQH